MTNITPDNYELLETLSGVKRQAAMQIIGETGGDMNAFENSSKLAGWAGLHPRNDESAGKLKSKAVTKGNKFLGRIMVQCALGGFENKRYIFQAEFEQLCIHKPREKAVDSYCKKIIGYCVVCS